MSEAKLILDMPARMYHANCGVDVPLFSASIAIKIANGSPLHAYAAHPLLGGHAGASTKAMEEGSILDALLSGDSDSIAITNDFDAFRSNEAKAWKAEQEAAGKMPLVAAKFAPYANAAERVRKNLSAAKCRLDDAWQPSILFTLHASNGNPVACKARLDHLQRETGTITDLKKIGAGAKPGPAIARHCYRYGYDIQAMMYLLAVERALPSMIGRASFEWAFYEAAQPYAVSRNKPKGTMRAVGARRMQDALDKWELALRTDEWPAYGDTVHGVDADPWMMDGADVEGADDDTNV